MMMEREIHVMFMKCLTRMLQILTNVLAWIHREEQLLLDVNLIEMRPNSVDLNSIRRVVLLSRVTSTQYYI